MHMKEFPPYPDNWTILNERVDDDVFDGVHYLVKEVDFAIISEDGVVLGDSSYWLSPTVGSWCGEQWRGSPDSGAFITTENFRKIAKFIL